MFDKKMSNGLDKAVSRAFGYQALTKGAAT